MKRLLTSLATVSIVVGMAGTASAILYDQNVTNEVIFGGGNVNGNFTVDQGSEIELGLRGKLRHDSIGLPQNTFNSNGDGTYSFDAGVAPNQSYPTAVWSFEWSINLNFDNNGGFLDDYSYFLGIDSDPTAGTDFTAGFDPINLPYADHSIGTNVTGNGLGVDALDGDTTAYSNLIAINNLAQNSWKPHWFISGFDPTADGTYDFYP